MSKSREHVLFMCVALLLLKDAGGWAATLWAILATYEAIAAFAAFVRSWSERDSEQ